MTEPSMEKVQEWLCTKSTEELELLTLKRMSPYKKMVLEWGAYGNRKIVPCVVCGSPVLCRIEESFCENCLEVRARIDTFLQCSNGRDFICSKLLERKNNDV